MSKKRKRANQQKRRRASSNVASVIVGKEVDSSRRKIIEKNDIISSSTDVDSSREKIIERNDIISSSTDVDSSREKIIENNDIISAVCQKTDTLSMPSCIGGNIGVENCKSSPAKHLELDGNNLEKVRHVKNECNTENKAGHYHSRADKYANHYVAKHLELDGNNLEKVRHVKNECNTENKAGHYHSRADKYANHYVGNSDDKNIHVENMLNNENRFEHNQHHVNDNAKYYFPNHYHHAKGGANYYSWNGLGRNIHVESMFNTENRVEPHQYHANGDANFYYFNPYQHLNGDANRYVCNTVDRNIHVENMFNNKYRVEPYRYHDYANYHFCNRGDKFTQNIHVESMFDAENKAKRYQYHANNDNIQVGTSLSSPSKRKLLILDLNGLLADIVMVYPSKLKPDFKIHKKSVFKRPFCEEFLQFCFENFDIAVWSSRRRANVDSVVSSLMAKLKDKLVFCWDQSHCTETGFQTVDNKHKPLVLKELNKVWDKKEPNLPWARGYYNPNNTLLLDDSPYKALCNPEYTGVFPPSYSYMDQNDKSLGPGGHLRVYLEGLLEAEDVPSFVKTNPFGQHYITNSNPHWPFYMRVIQLVESSSLS